MDKKLFGKNHDGKDVYAFTLSNEFVEVTVLTYGATVQSLKYKGKERVLGYDSLEEYVSYMAGVCGHYFGKGTQHKTFCETESWKIIWQYCRQMNY